jgi:hypothetical protein
VGRGLLCAVAALVVLAPAAQAARIHPSGSVVVRWHSDPGTCAAFGLCGRSGTLSWRLDPGSSALDLVSGFGSLSVYGGRSVVRSHRLAGDRTATCIDAPESPFDLQVDSAGRGRVIVTMRHVEEFSAGRCAGPLAGDFAGALPQSPPVATAALRQGAVIDLRGRAAFGAGPFAGEVVSTLTLRTARTRPETGDGGTTQTTPLVRKGPRVRYGRLLVTYAIERTAGQFGFTFEGTPAPACETFDTCGLSGHLGMRAEHSGGRLTVSSLRRLAPGAEETVGSGMRALAAGGTHVYSDALLGDEPGPEPAPAPGLPVEEASGFPGEQPCTDTSAVREVYLAATRSRGGVRIRLIRGGNALPDELRTRCPGPASDDLGALAGGLLQIDAIGSKAPSVTLRPATAFQTPAFNGRGQGQVELRLRLLSIRARTTVVRVTHDVEGF